MIEIIFTLLTHNSQFTILTKYCILSQIKNIKVQIHAVMLLKVTTNDLQKVELFYRQMDLPHGIQIFPITFYVYFAKSYLRP